jgi:protein subunit release factor A
VHDIDRVMLGDTLDRIVDALIAEDRAAKLAALP